ncbi:glycosyl hydrolase family 8 [uncultured Sphingomonas sp.]|uniref:glycosyl hydrolase family 8 n=1 Tax=uncultured Sphingomonas sp. TaxID=158754 RepID=UPI0025EF003B|nr:glycosyl hydrolase family 8 [uncultured Sphingomonas sp.]
MGIVSGFALGIMLAAVPVQAQAPAAPTAKPALSTNPLGEQTHVDAPLGEVRRFPGDGTGAFATGRHRNLFAEQLGKSEQDTRAKIEAAFQRFFHGDGQEETVYFETGVNADGPLAYITDWANNDARSEGMSYGMMIAVQLNKKREFDALWNWSKTHMQVTDPANPSFGYFAWSMSTDGRPRSVGAAPDGEEYYAMALYFAANRWGNGQGIYDYKAEADKILTGMRHRAVMTGTPPFRIHPGDAPLIPPSMPWPSPNNRTAAAEAAAKGTPWPPAWYGMVRQNAPVTVGPMVEESHAMIRFVPETSINTTDASYHLPHFYELWARWGPEQDRAFWSKAADVSRDLLVKVVGPNTALSPERSHFDGSRITGRDGKPVEFGYDSWRTVSNWSVDWAWFGKDARQRTLSDRNQHFLFGQGIKSFPDQYTLDGKPLSRRHSPGMVAAAAVGGFAAAPGPVSRAFLQELWDMPLPTGEQRYFDGMLYLMSMMHLGGEFRIIQSNTARRPAS